VPFPFSLETPPRPSHLNLYHSLFKPFLFVQFSFLVHRCRDLSLNSRGSMIFSAPMKRFKSLCPVPMVMVQFRPKSAPMSTKAKPKILWEKSVPKEGQKWEKEETLDETEPSENEAMLKGMKERDRNSS